MEHSKAHRNVQQGAPVMSLSVPKPALTNALTKVDARFCRAESTAGPLAARPSTRCILYTCPGAT